MPDHEITVIAPGRVCLFGEHQDYLRLPVISAAISLYIEIKAKETQDKQLIIDLQDLDQQEIIPLNNREVQYKYSRDYLRSSYNLFIRKGYRLSQGYYCRISGDIPFSAGAGSSSALVIAWAKFLSHVFRANLSTLQIADFGYQAEVDEFREAGGRMDHFTSALGGLIYLNTIPPFDHENLEADISGIVLGDSLERKDTVSDLSRVKEQVVISISEMRRNYKDFDLKKTTIEDLTPMLDSVFPEVAKKISANLINRDLTQKAKKLLSISDFSRKDLGELIDLHHTQLRDNLHVSTPKIEKLIAAAKEAGALGAKINGSGFGGSMIAYAPDAKAEVAQAIEAAGGKAYVLEVARGCKLFET